MKIDLHCHTKKVKSGDAQTRAVSREVFAKKIADADVKIVAITNHNEFDIAQYEIFKNTVAEFCQVWPGIELDIVDESNVRWHLIVVINPRNAKQFSDKTNSMLNNTNKDEITFRIADVVKAFSSMDALYIPHYHKKPAIPENDLNQLYSLVPEQYRIFLETANNRSLGIFANYQYKVIIGSDVQDWKRYEKCTFAELRLPIETFDQFILLARRDVVNVDTLLSKTTAVPVKATPHKGVHLYLELFPEMNIIFGQKGTGKSEIISSMAIDLQSQGKTCSVYRGSDKDEDFKKLLSTAGLRHKMQDLGREDGEKGIEVIRSWHDTAPTAFSEYKIWYETKEKNKNKQSMRITNATKMPEIPSTAFEEAISDRNASRAIQEYLNKIRCEKYLSKDEIGTLHSLIKKLETACQESATNTYIEKQAISLANYSIEKIKSIADKNTDTKSFPSTTGFYEYAVSRIAIKKEISKLLDVFHTKPVFRPTYLGTLEEKGAIYITTVYRVLGEESKTAEFSIGIRTLQEIYRLLTEIRKHIFDTQLQSFIAEFDKACRDSNIATMDPFVGVSKIITTEDRAEYKPSNGEKGILLLQKELDAEADAYFIDEPELGMGNSYIDQCIRPKLSNLAKRKKIVVVATHNANIAVRTLPYQSIFRQYKNGTYATYVGNPFTNKLVNIDDESMVLSWKDESMHTLEGGQEAFYEREHIYDAGSHQC